jgi:hypothetical protein
MLAGWASSHNWSFKETGGAELYQQFECLPKAAFNIITGDIDKQKVCTFDCKYRGSTVVLYTDIPLKPLSIRHEGFGDKVADSLDADDDDEVKLESTEFNSRFHVKSPDHQWAYDVLSQETMDFLLKSQQFHLDFYDNNITAYRDSTSFFKIADFEDAIKVTTGILDRLPASLIQELKGVDNSRSHHHAHSHIHSDQPSPCNGTNT